jgi:hypothetical protein
LIVVIFPTTCIYTHCSGTQKKEKSQTLNPI